MAIPYSKKMLIERVRRHIANGWPMNDFTISENEVNLYIDSAIATTVVASMIGIAKITKELATPEAYTVTTQLAPLVKNEITGEWYTTLPQTPLSLSIGYSITNAYFGDVANGQSEPIWFIKGKRSAYRNYMPRPNGTSAEVRGNTINIKASDGSPLLGYGIFVDMVSTRTTDVNAPMNLPDDALESVFDKTVMKCLQRMNIPIDVVKDDIGQGATNINKA